MSTIGCGNYSGPGLFITAVGPGGSFEDVSAPDMVRGCN